MVIKFIWTIFCNGKVSYNYTSGIEGKRRVRKMSTKRRRETWSTGSHICMQTGMYRWTVGYENDFLFSSLLIFPYLWCSNCHSVGLIVLHKLNGVIFSVFSKIHRVNKLNQRRNWQSDAFKMAQANVTVTPFSGQADDDFNQFEELLQEIVGVAGTQPAIYLPLYSKDNALSFFQQVTAPVRADVDQSVAAIRTRFVDDKAQVVHVLR